MSRQTRGAVWVVRAAFLAALGVELLAIHFPAPDDSQPERVNDAWSTAGRIARSGSRFVPDFVDAILDPLIDDKTAHFVLFLPLGILATAERRLHGSLTWRRLAKIAFALSAYALFGELAQGLYGRYPELGDWIANTLGVLTGVGGVALVTRSPAVRRRPEVDLSRG